MPIVTVFIPLMHIQVAPPTILCDYTFRSGAQLSAKTPIAVIDAVKSLKKQDPLRWVTDLELNCLGSARGWLWAQENVEYVPGHEYRNRFAQQLAWPLDTLLACIHLAGAGENSHWAFGSFQDNWRMYVSSGFSHADLPFRIRALHCLQTEVATAWSPDRMAIADDLHSALRSYTGAPIARLDLAFHSYLTLAGLDPTKLVERNLRLQIAVSGLETFYIAPTERLHLWCDEVQRRLTSVCETPSSQVAHWCALIRDTRNDVVHRAGLQPTSTENPRIHNACVAAESLLRSTLCWGIKRRAAIDEAFEANRWPSSAH